MIIRWRTGVYKVPIQQVEFVRETKHFYVTEQKDHKGRIEERRQAKDSHYEQFHDSWEEARNYLVEKTKGEILATKERLERLENKLSRYSALEKPEEA